MTMVIVALALAALFVAGGIAWMETARGFDAVLGWFLGVMPGLAGLGLALVALAVHLVPAWSAWSWLPATLSCGATVSMVAYAAGVKALSRLFG